MIKLKENNNFYVITGGPGVGKTTLLEALKKRNYNMVPEIARELIKEQQKDNGTALPWKDKNLYKEMMFDRSIISFEETDKNAKTEKPIFFDRGFIDAICYADIIDSEIDGRMKSYAAHWRYNKNVFLLPAWKKIYETDNERKQDWKEAVLTSEKMSKTYKSYGYRIIEVPKMSINKRADFILEFIKMDNTEHKNTNAQQ
ncbi:ATPase, AAA family [Formosa agariphila KMM 3901]|uniref:ATPase, AAA family n=1 Tax=Formosa agariphila (strain DSM 15362 / KCTC 12365 / LMG 23005 / KMM 3901 / M-2Alg 35-1) TaxID=1347342 RepID=T2KN37_FORAG|nr:AAA family ATPase [Formosa agariphila]CDF80170.1 ATPase, AAA family [Formosa agariphila KMM 3901]